MSTSDDDTVSSLVEDYLQVVNRALREHENRWPYSRIMGRQDAGITAVVYVDDDSSRTYRVQLRDGRLVAEPGNGIAGRWVLRRSHLEAVVDQPEPYVDRPGRLPLDWLRMELAFRGDSS